MKKLMMHCLVVSMILSTTVKAELLVFSKPYNPKDIVIEVGRWKLTARNLEKHGIKPMNVTITNSGVVEEVFTPDMPCMTAAEVYTRLSKSIFISAIEGLLIGLCVSGTGVGIYIGTLLEPNERKNLFSIGLQERIEKVSQYARDFVDCIFESANPVPKIVTRFSIICPVLVLMCIRYRSNSTLYALLQENLLAEPISIAPGQTVTKLVCVSSNVSA